MGLFIFAGWDYRADIAASAKVRFGDPLIVSGSDA
jgi:hypothetical protein